MKRRVGYIVCDEDWCHPLSRLKRDNEAWKSVPAAGILLKETREASMFCTRAAALSAVARTRNYFRRVHNREAGIFKIIPIKEAA